MQKHTLLRLVTLCLTLVSSAHASVQQPQAVPDSGPNIWFFAACLTALFLGGAAFSKRRHAKVSG
jgi:hypothetical protein